MQEPVSEQTTDMPQRPPVPGRRAKRRGSGHRADYSPESEQTESPPRPGRRAAYPPSWRPAPQPPAGSEASGTAQPPARSQRPGPPHSPGPSEPSGPSGVAGPPEPGPFETGPPGAGSYHGRRAAYPTTETQPDAPQVSDGPFTPAAESGIGPWSNEPGSTTTWDLPRTSPTGWLDPLGLDPPTPQPPPPAESAEGGAPAPGPGTVEDPLGLLSSSGPAQGTAHDTEPSWRTDAGSWPYTPGTEPDPLLTEPPIDLPVDFAGGTSAGGGPEDALGGGQPPMSSIWERDFTETTTSWQTERGWPTFDTETDLRSGSVNDLPSTPPEPPASRASIPDLRPEPRVPDVEPDARATPAPPEPGRREAAQPAVVESRRPRGPRPLWRDEVAPYTNPPPSAPAARQPIQTGYPARRETRGRSERGLRGWFASVLGLLLTLAVGSMDLYWSGSLDLMFAASFAGIAFGLAVLVRRSDLFTAGVLPPLELLFTLVVLGVAAPERLNPAASGPIEAVLSALAASWVTLVAATAIAIGTIVIRAALRRPGE